MGSIARLLCDDTNMRVGEEWKGGKARVSKPVTCHTCADNSCQQRTQISIPHICCKGVLTSPFHPYTEIVFYVRGRVSKYVTNWSKTAVMDVISFIYVSLGTAQSSFMTVLVADVHVQKLVSVVKMATMLEAYTTEEQRPGVFFVGNRTQCKGYS
jgi:hypothetical protein